MDYNNIRLELEHPIAVLTINRPDRLNALDIETIHEVGQALDAVADDDEVRGLIITGAGEKAFAAGADIAEFAKFTQQEAKSMSSAGHDVFNKLENFHKPVIAAINGYALGGGCELAMACHMRIASDKAKLGQPEVNLGLIPGYGGTQRLTAYVGRAKATELLLTGDIVDADDALRLGLLNYVVPPEDLIDHSRKLLLQITSKATEPVAHILKLINLHFSKEADGYGAEKDLFSECFDTPTFKEGVDAFLNKRKPEFH